MTNFDTMEAWMNSDPKSDDPFKPAPVKITDQKDIGEPEPGFAKFQEQGSVTELAFQERKLNPSRSITITEEQQSAVRKIVNGPRTDKQKS